MDKYYELFIIQKLKNDVIDTFQDIKCKGVEDVINSYFDVYELKLETHREKYNIKEYSNNIYRDRDLYKDRIDCCIARVWNCGMGGQCSRDNAKDGFCNMHYDKGGKEWWLGTINKCRPCNPINHTGKVHYWLR